MIAYHCILPFSEDETKQLKKSQFLAHNIFYLKPHEAIAGSAYSVRDFILMCANRFGGIHYSDPASDKERERWLRSANEFMFSYGAPIAFSNLAEIATVVIEGVAPLIQAINPSH